MSMRPGNSTEPVAAVDSLLGYRVATLHFQDRLSNLEIASELGISRFRVARLLEQATNSGMVRIRVAVPAAVDEDLSAEVAGTFGLQAARVLADEPDGEWRAHGVAALTLQHVNSLLHDGSRLGIAWGRTLEAVMRSGSHMQIPYPRADVVQLVGGVPSATGSLEASDLVRRWSLLTGGESIVLNAPLMAPTREVAEGLRAERSVAATLAAAASVDVALSSIGTWGVRQSRFSEVQSTADRKDALRAGAFSDYSAVLISRSGELVECAVMDRTIGIRPDALRRIPRRVGVILGSEKAAAARAVMQSGLVTDLVLDGVCARDILGHAAGRKARRA